MSTPTVFIKIPPLTEIEKKYKTRETTPEQTMEQRINRLEAEVDLLLLFKETVVIKALLCYNTNISTYKEEVFKCRSHRN